MVHNGAETLSDTDESSPGIFGKLEPVAFSQVPGASRSNISRMANRSGRLTKRDLGINRHQFCSDSYVWYGGKVNPYSSALAYHRAAVAKSLSTPPIPVA